MKNILCFGDSNTYGYIPGYGGRFDINTRWPGILANRLHPYCRIIEEGLCGRTTVFEDEFPGRRAIDFIGPCVRSHNPLDMIIFMLGSNDCKSQFKASAKDIAKGMEDVIILAKESCLYCSPIILLVSPPLLDNKIWHDFNKESVETCRALAAEYMQLAYKNNLLFLDAAIHTAASKTDFLHLDKEGHLKLANAVEKVIRENMDILTF